MIWGYDVSHYQPNFDHYRARREGFDFAILKATEGDSYVDNRFARHLNDARGAGMIVAAYHYVRSGASAASQADRIARVVPRDVPVILDVEQGAGGIGLTRDLNARLNAMGYRTPLLYLPQWYWQQIGRPDLRGLPPLWYSRYPNNNGGTASGIWNANATWLDQFWGGYGGLWVEVLQFTSSASIAGNTPTDANAYRGTREQLAALFSGGAIPPPPIDLSIFYTEDAMPRVPAGGAQNNPTSYTFAVSALREHDLIIAPGSVPVVVYNVFNWSQRAGQGTGGNPIYNDMPYVVGTQEGCSWIIPRGTTKIDLLYHSDSDFSVAVLPR